MSTGGVAAGGASATGGGQDAGLPDANTQTGGTTGTGGTTATGGITGAGGDTAAGGTTVAGGTAVAGGTSATGGSTAAGGTSGGTTATGGAATAGKSGGSAGGSSGKGGTGGQSGDLPTFTGTYVFVPNPCTTTSCMPGMVAAIQTSTGTSILVINGAWVWSGTYYNGFRMGDSIRVQGYGTGGGIDVVSMTHVVASGAGGAAGSSGTGGAAGAMSSPGTGGPAMVRLPEGFFIDSTEVTRGQYEAWLATNPSTSTQTADCTSNTTFAPDTGCMGDASACQGDDCNRPQACVDWCDAFQYCKAVGKRLCGNLAGDATKSEWSIACSANGRNLWVYGNDYDASVCNVPDQRLDTTVLVGSLIGCQSNVFGYEGVYDLIGNVSEWDDGCNGGSCHPRGSAFRLWGREDIQSRCTDTDNQLSNAHLPNLGFRCCAS